MTSWVEENQLALFTQVGDIGSSFEPPIGEVRLSLLDTSYKVARLLVAKYVVPLH